MTHAAAAQTAASVTIPAFEEEGNLLALVPKAALRGSHTDIDIVIVGKSSGSIALVAELKSASSHLRAGRGRTRLKFALLSLSPSSAAESDRRIDRTALETSSPAMTALLSRLVRALTRVAGMAGDDLVHRALERPSDMGATIDLLRSALPLLSAERELDPEVEAQVASLEAEEDLIRRAGGLKDTKWAADYLGISPKSVAAKARRNELLAITRGDRNLYPAVQFRNGQVVLGIREILQALPLTNGWSRLSFLLTSDPGLDDRTPLDAFASAPDAVLAVAAGGDTQGAP